MAGAAYMASVSKSAVLWASPAMLVGEKWCDGDDDDRPPPVADVAVPDSRRLQSVYCVKIDRTSSVHTSMTSKLYVTSNNVQHSMECRKS